MGGEMESENCGEKASEGPGVDGAAERGEEVGEDVEACLREAHLLRSRCKLHEAICFYNRVLNHNPRHAVALNSKGVCFKLLNNVAEAMACHRHALILNPMDPIALNNCGVIAKESGKWNDAIALYRRALEADPHYTVARENLAVVLTDVGTQSKTEGRTDEAVAYYTEALDFNPNYAPALYNLGVTNSEIGLTSIATAYYNRAIAANPYYVEAHCNLGVLAKNAGRLEEAIRWYDLCLALDPNFTIARNNMAIALTDLGTKVKAEEGAKAAIQLYKRALVFNPRYADAHYNLGVAYAEYGRWGRAAVSYDLALQFNPQFTEAWNNLGVLYKERENPEKALECYMAALGIDPVFPQTLNNVGVVLTVQGKLEEAREKIQRAVEVNPFYAEAYNNLGVLMRDEGDITEAIKYYEKCLSLDPESHNAGQNLLLALNYSEHYDAEDIFEAHRAWGTRFQAKFGPVRRDHLNDKDPTRVIRVGYISPDFFTHSVSYFVEALVRHHRPEKVHVTCYSNVARGDRKTAMLSTLAHCWRPVHGMTDVEVASMIEKDKIDILIELAGHTAGNRLDVMAHKPAPLQMTYIGYPNTTGLPSIDYRLTDDVVDPSNSEQQYVEALLRVPDCFLCYSPVKDLAEVAPLPFLANGVVTFGCFNNVAKIRPCVIQLWIRILRALPKSRLLIKAKPFASESVRNKFLTMFEGHGISTSQVDLMPLLPLTRDHLAVYSLVDMALDTFPYAGTTTTCEALLMGVPVVTLRGALHARNVGASLLKQVDLETLVASTEDEYVEKAICLAQDIDQLSTIRRTLRHTMVSSPLCDGPAFVRKLETIFRDVWTRWCNERR